MGGFFSGRTGWHATCEGMKSIDVRRWAREGYLSRAYFSWQWERDGEQTGSIGVYGHPNRVELRYAKDGEQHHYAVPLATTPCHLGGRRFWFRCPLTHCGRRTAMLYLGGSYFACRRCCNLVYQSQRYSPHERALVQAGKIRVRLGGEYGVANPFPPKPKRMHWRTYECLRERCEQYEGIANVRLFRLIARLAR